MFLLTTRFLLSGFGNSSKPVSNVDHVGFLDAVLKEFQLDKVVVVSPSMSGNYSIEYLQKLVFDKAASEIDIIRIYEILQENNVN